MPNEIDPTATVLLLDLFRETYLQNMALREVLSELEGWDQKDVEAQMGRFRALVSQQFDLLYAAASNPDAFLKYVQDFQSPRKPN